MKIAQIAPIWYRIPPRKYGGTEQIVSTLTEGLVKKGHNVTLFASGDSLTSAHLESIIDKPLIEQGFNFQSYSYPIRHMLNAIKHAKDFDILHFHFTSVFDYVTLALTREVKNKIFTLHVPLPKKPELIDRRKFLEEECQTVPFVSISDTQQFDFKLNFARTVYNGIESEKFSNIKVQKNNSILWLSRIAHHKGTYEALEVAQKLHKNIIIAGMVDKTVEKDVEYYENKIKQFFDQPDVNFTGEADFDMKKKLYSTAKLFLFPIQWEEPFGLVIIEAMACGTPVVAYARGSVPEIIEDGKTGYIVNSSDSDIRGNFIIKKTGMEGLYDAVNRIYEMSEKEYRAMCFACKDHVQKNFTVKKMVNGYEKIYNDIVLT